MDAIIRADGSFFEVGEAVGAATRAETRFAIGRIVPDLAWSRFRGDWKAMYDAVRVLLGPAAEFFPAAVDYLEGLARGAGCRLADVLVNVFSEELSVDPLVAETRAEKCSTLVVRARGGWVLGHNEDFWPAYLGRMPMLDLRFRGHPRTVSLNYPGQLPHLAGSLNEAGIAIANNSLWPPATPGLSKQLKHFRATLACSMDEAIRTLSSGPQTLTDHYTVISGDEDLACSLEVSHPSVSESEAEVRAIGATPFCHTNSVLYLPLHEPDPRPWHGCARLAKLRSIPQEETPASPDAMLRFLSREDGILNRAPGRDLLDRPDSVTLATIVIAPRRRQFRARRYSEEGSASVRADL